MTIKIGADPELFLFNTKSEEVINAFGIIPGTKSRPFKVKRGAVQVDGIALEFNINPATSEDAFVRNTTVVMKQLRGMLPKGTDYKIKSAVNISRAFLEQAPAASLELGCEVDYSAYSRLATPLVIVQPEIIRDKSFRTAAGHIHIGWRDDNIEPLDPTHFAECQMVAQQLDMFLAVPFVDIDPIQNAQQRRSLYGKAGSFRPKSYGIEYRVLSNHWLTSKDYIRHIYRTCNKVINDIIDGKCLINVEMHNRDTYITRHIINHCSRSDVPKHLKMLCSNYYRVYNGSTGRYSNDNRSAYASFSF